MPTTENPYLTAKRRRYDELREQVTAVQTRAVEESRDLSEDELRSVNEAAETCRTLADEIEELTEVETRSRRVAELNASLSEGAGGERAADAVPLLMPSTEQTRELYDAARAGQRYIARTAEQTHTRAVVATADVGTPTRPLDAVELTEPRRLAAVANLAAMRVAGAEGVTFPVFAPGAAIAATAEGAPKPEYDAITPGTAAPQMLSVWTDYTRQAATTQAAFTARLRQALAARLARAEDALLVTRALGTVGIGAYVAAAGEPYAHSLLGGAALVLDSDAASAPTVAVLNPADLVAVFGDAVGQFGESPTDGLRMGVHGMLVYPTSAVATGTALVGAWRASARYVVGQELDYMVDPYTQMKSNTITLLAELAVDLAVDVPGGFARVTFATA